MNSLGTAIYTGGMTDVNMSFGIGSYNFSDGSFRGIWDWDDLSSMEKIGYTAGALANLQDVTSLFGGGTKFTVGAKVTRGDMTGHAYGYNVNDNIDISVASATDWNSGSKTAGTLGYEARYLYQKFVPHKGRYYGSVRYQGKGWERSLYNVNKKILQGATQKLLAGGDPVSGGSLLYGFLNGCQSHVGRVLWMAGVPTLPINFHPWILMTQIAIREQAIYTSGIMVNR